MIASGIFIKLKISLIGFDTIEAEGELAGQ